MLKIVGLVDRLVSTSSKLSDMLYVIDVDELFLLVYTLLLLDHTLLAEFSLQLSLLPDVGSD